MKASLNLMVNIIREETEDAVTLTWRELEDEGIVYVNCSVRHYRISRSVRTKWRVRRQC